MALTVGQATTLITIARDALNAGAGTSALPGRPAQEFLIPMIRSRIAASVPANVATFDSLLAGAAPADMANLIAGAIAAAGIT